VRIDQPRHERFASEIEVGRYPAGRTILGNRRNDAVLQQDETGFTERGVHPVKDARVREQYPPGLPLRHHTAANARHAGLRWVKRNWTSVSPDLISKYSLLKFLPSPVITPSIVMAV
jgi:hypothetical protein